MESTTIDTLGLERADIVEAARAAIARSTDSPALRSMIFIGLAMKPHMPVELILEVYQSRGSNTADEVLQMRSEFSMRFARALKRLDSQLLAPSTIALLAELLGSDDGPASE